MKNQADTLIRAEKFYQEAVDSECVYFIKTQNGAPLFCPSNELTDQATMEPLPIIPVWSKSFLAYARAYGEDLNVFEIPFEEFFYGMLPSMRNEGILVGINWDQKGIGVELAPGDVVRNLAKLLNKKKSAENILREEKFFEEAFKSEKVFYLASKDNDKVLICPSYESMDPQSNEPKPLIPFWSESYVEFAKSYGSEFEIEEIQIEVLKNDMLQDMYKDGILVGINLDENGFGIEENADSIIKKLGGTIK